MKTARLLSLLSLTFLCVTPTWATTLGVPNLNATVSNPDGDFAPAFAVHSFPAPNDGFLTELTIRQDSDGIDEAMDFLVLRGPLSSLEVIHRVNLSPDETGAGWIDNGDGTQTHNLGMLAVQADDVFGHWHASTTGPVSTDVPDGAQGGMSEVQPNIPSGDLDVGDIYTDGFVNDHRDYLLRARFETPPLAAMATTTVG